MQLERGLDWFARIATPETLINTDRANSSEARMRFLAAESPGRKRCLQYRALYVYILLWPGKRNPLITTTLGPCFQQHPCMAAWPDIGRKAEKTHHCWTQVLHNHAHALHEFNLPCAASSWLPEYLLETRLIVMSGEVHRGKNSAYVTIIEDLAAKIVR